MANRGKSSTWPVCLDGLQILAESRSSGRKKAASTTFDKVRSIHKTNKFSLILTEKGLKNTQMLESGPKKTAKAQISMN